MGNKHDRNKKRNKEITTMHILSKYNHSSNFGGVNFGWQDMPIQLCLTWSLPMLRVSTQVSPSVPFSPHPQMPL